MTIKLISDDDLTHAVLDFIECCDSEELAAVAEGIFGGKLFVCTDGSDMYEFEADSKYCGDLDKYLEDANE